MIDKPASGVGHKRPPEHTRWKKGQPGNSRSRRKEGQQDVTALMNKMLAKKMETVIDGVPRRLTALQAIILQLWIKTVSGDKRAEAVFLRYLQLDPSKEGEQVIVIGGLPQCLPDEEQ